MSAEPVTQLSIAWETVLAARRLAGEDPAALVGLLRDNKFPLLSLLGRLPSEVAGSWELPEALAERLSAAEMAQLEAAIAEDWASYAGFHGEYVQLARAWARLGVPAICIKSAGIPPSFPYTSDNFDILVPASQVGLARRALLELGYIEMTNTEEHLKWLFRRFVGGRNVSLIHLHARVSWTEGFMLEGEIWQRCRQSPDDPWTTIPGREDALLINLAHALIENKAVSLHDLMKIRHALSGGEIDWRYLDRVAAERGWLDCLHLGLAVLAHLEDELYGASSIPEEERTRHLQTLQRQRWLAAYWRRRQRQEVTFPYAISFTVSKLLFFAKLWRDRHLPASQKPLHTLLALAEGIKQKSGLHLQNSMLVALSGIDGGGKTSQARALQQALDVSHVRSRILWTRIGDTPLLHLLRRGREKVQRDFDGHRPFQRHGWRLLLWALVASADYGGWLQYVRWRLWRGDVVIADRYLCDFEVELSERLKRSPWLAAALVALLRPLAPRPRCAYLLRLDPALSIQRKPDPDFRDLAPQRLQRRYDALAGRYGLNVLDAGRPPEDVASVIVHDVLTSYMASFHQLVRALFFANPAQLNRAEERLQP